MGKTHEYLQQELGLDKKTSEAIKILMEEGLLEPLLVNLRDAIETEEFQHSHKPIGNNFDSHLKNSKEEMSPIEAELVEGSGLPLKTVREILGET